MVKHNQDCVSRSLLKRTNLKELQDQRIFHQISITKKSTIMSSNFYESCNYIIQMTYDISKNKSDKQIAQKSFLACRNIKRTLNLKIIEKVLESLIFPSWYFLFSFPWCERLLLRHKFVIHHERRERKQKNAFQLISVSIEPFVYKATFFL